jgi:peptidoglycan/xylan/chitin deacetylase (PgdA/CDA1 family)
MLYSGWEIARKVTDMNPANIIAALICGATLVMIIPIQSEAKDNKPKQILVTSSWDDGDINDVRLIEVLKRHHAKGTFFIFPEKYVRLQKDPEAAIAHDKRLIPFDQFLTVYKGFEIGAHGYTHPDMRNLSPKVLEWELKHSKQVLEDWFKVPVTGMAYPYGAYNKEVDAAVSAAGYVYSRTCEHDDVVFPPKDPCELKVSCHVNDPKFWDEFERVKRTGGVFYFWGHSYEIRTEEDWKRFEENVARLSADPQVRWVTNIEMFEKKH